MSSYDADSEALEKICGDMDDMESEKLFKKKEEPKSGVSVTIELAPKAEEKKEEPVAAASEDDDEMKMPPFLRKKK